MKTTVTINVRIPSEGLTLCGYELEPLGEGLYRAVVVPAVFEAEHFGYMDVLELKEASDGVHELVHVRERGGWHRFDFVISEEVAKSDRLTALLSRVWNAGGIWVRDFGGCLSILFPPGAGWDPTEEIDAACRADPAMQEIRS